MVAVLAETRVHWWQQTLQENWKIFNAYFTFVLILAGGDVRNGGKLLRNQSKRRSKTAVYIIFKFKVSYPLRGTCFWF